MDEYTRDIISDLRDDVAARAGFPTGAARAITCCHPGMVAVLAAIGASWVMYIRLAGARRACSQEGK